MEITMETSVRKTNLRRWLKVQMELLEKLIEKNELDKKDVNRFIEFGQFFFDFVDEFRRSPSLKEVEKALKLGELAMP
jgi:hypothetical protein